ncbi:hypothetical protein GUITHDRAFT_146682 [Guillardia theta CCMP2712]|uniref:PB1 domain-containing protein n=1 Tax=Guillardia theta (strain CCMP2712) TaxID=905079 RepID=L1IFZ0_GUITC|nr:hypothetical protein GUITHDRAFT_146682 [Guillardia theta CCMP2712]EKX35181.1 hypothetical protein GUITHDRAFT_146682 [Guillardia theta CCMP2712]|eukprot:XP_005822161.1 hypothetical protein GUITHDRAFT_146682 [Guillardia theta CCMP2712]
MTNSATLIIPTPPAPLQDAHHPARRCVQANFKITCHDKGGILLRRLILSVSVSSTGMPVGAYRELMYHLESAMSGGCLSWTDEEEDEIVITSDHDLGVALKHLWTREGCTIRLQYRRESLIPGWKLPHEN